MKTKIIRRKIYSVDWYNNGFCYRTTTGCTWEQVQDCRRTARMLGEKIRYEVTDIREDEYHIF